MVEDISHDVLFTNLHKKIMSQVAQNSYIWKNLWEDGSGWYQ